jgi:hypothetical protein
MSGSATGIKFRNWAIIGSLLLNVATLPLTWVLPGADEAPSAVIVIGFVFSALAIAGAYGLYQGARWGWHITFWANVAALLGGLGAIGDWPSAWVGVTSIVFIALGIGELVLLRNKELRATVH